MDQAALGYDADVIERFYDAYADREWQRFEDSPAGRVNLAVHQRFLADHLDAGMRVLDIGAGPGRFTIEAVQRGATVVVGDLSGEMLRQNEERVVAAGAEHGVEQRLRLDVTDLSRLPDGAFDVAVCFGGPISYALDRADTAVSELLRVTRPDGVVLCSVMSVLGGARTLLPGVIADAVARGYDNATRIFETGELPPEVSGHPLRMYRWSELEALIERAGAQVIDRTAANYLTPGYGEELVDDVPSAAWDWLVEREIAACREPGVIDAGTHILSRSSGPGTGRGAISTAAPSTWAMCAGVSS